MAETRSLHRKLAQVMYEAERIPKRGKAPAAMGGFEFVQVGDAADFIRKALTTHFGAEIFRRLGAAYEPLVLGGATLAVMWALLYGMYRQRWFLKI
jgi:hypothetical protein